MVKAEIWFFSCVKCTLDCHIYFFVKIFVTFLRGRNPKELGVDFWDLVVIRCRTGFSLVILMEELGDIWKVVFT